MNEIEKIVTQAHYKITKKRELIDKLLNDNIFVWGEIVDNDTNKINVNLIEDNQTTYIPIFLDEQMCLEACPQDVGILSINGKEFLTAYKDFNVVIHPELDDFLILKSEEIEEILNKKEIY